MDYQIQIYDLIKEFTGSKNNIPVNRIFVLYLGDFIPAVFLGQVIYWTDRAKMNDGWFFKKYDEWFDEICLTEYQVRRSAQLLKKMKLLETKIKKAHGAPTLHYRFDKVKFSVSFLEFLKNRNLSFSRIDSAVSQDTMESEVSQGTITINESQQENTSIAKKIPFSLTRNFSDIYVLKYAQKNNGRKYQWVGKRDGKMIQDIMSAFNNETVESALIIWQSIVDYQFDNEPAKFCGLPFIANHINEIIGQMNNPMNGKRSPGDSGQKTFNALNDFYGTQI